MPDWFLSFERPRNSNESVVLLFLQAQQSLFYQEMCSTHSSSLTLSQVNFAFVK